MPVTQSDNIAVVFNGSGILAESATITTRNTLNPVQSLNRHGSIKQSPRGGLESTFNISYFVEISDPILRHVGFLRTGVQNFHFDGQVVSVGGITGNCYLTNYNIKIEPNKIGRATVGFSSYNDLSGYLQNTPSTINFAVLGGTGLLHGYSTFIPDKTNYTTSKTYDFEYGITMNWNPVYVIGNPFPNQVNLMGGVETFSITKDYYTGVKFSGSFATGAWKMNGHQATINELRNVSTNDSYESFLINMSGAQFNEVRVEPGDDFVKVIGVGQNYF